MRNKAAGDGWRDDVASFLRGQGRTVVTDGENAAALTIATPYGKRTFDLGVWNSGGKLLGYVEAKHGGSAYTIARKQRTHGYVRDTDLISM